MRRGRPKMEEEFFYNPYEKDFTVNIQISGLKVGDYVVGHTSGSVGVVVQIRNNTDVIVDYNDDFLKDETVGRLR